MASVGRPRAFQDGERLQADIDAYFATIGPQILKNDEGEPVYTQYGKPVILSTRHPSFFALARHLGVSRETLYAEMRNESPFSDTIRRANDRIQEYMVERMMDSDVKPQGVQFVLKNIHGWKDETETKVSGALTHQGDADKPIVQQVNIVLVEPKKQPEEKSLTTEPEGI